MARVLVQWVLRLCRVCRLCAQTMDYRTLYTRFTGSVRDSFSVTVPWLTGKQTWEMFGLELCRPAKAAAL